MTSPVPVPEPEPAPIPPPTTLSDDRRYRYTLHRSTGLDAPQPKRVLFVMLNPSTADETNPDRTMTTCLLFARRWEGTDLLIGNLFAFRSTDPRALRSEPDPVGPDNDRWLQVLASMADVIVCGWGKHASAVHPLRAAKVLGMLRAAHEPPLYHLKLNKDGSPSHPLYLPLASPLTPFGEAYGAPYASDAPVTLP